MQKYGVLENGELLITAKKTAGSKPIIYAKVPEFDQELQAVYEGAITDEGDHISVGVEIRDVEIQDESGDESGQGMF